MLAASKPQVAWFVGLAHELVLPLMEVFVLAKEVGALAWQTVHVLG